MEEPEFVLLLYDLPVLTPDSNNFLVKNKRIRKIIIAMKGFDIVYTSPQMDKFSGKEIIAGISQDEKLFALRQDNVFYLWRRNQKGRLYVWKKIINMPVMVEYDDEV